MQNQSNRLVCLGFGYVAQHLAAHMTSQGWQVLGTSRTPQEHPHASVVLPDEAAAYLAQAQAVLVSVPPGEGQEWALALCQASVMPSLGWLGYLSSTGVYGDFGGDWVDEVTPCQPHDARTQARLDAELAWRALAHPVHAFRLAGIYGPKRNALESLIEGKSRQIVKEGQYFSRIHVEDISRVLVASLRAPKPGVIYNVADDEPSPSHEVTAYAAKLLSMQAPPIELFQEAEMSTMMRSFYSANRRVCNQRIKSELGIELAYPSYREGLTALYEDMSDA